MDNLLEKLRDLAEEERFEAALALCDEALVSAARDDRSRLWGLRSYVHQMMDRYDLAVQDASAGLAEEPRSLSLLFERATCMLQLHRYKEANADLEQTLQIERERCENFLQAAALILSVLCLNRLGRAREALSLCESIPLDARMWALDRLWTREDLEAECRALLSDP